MNKDLTWNYQDSIKILVNCKLLYSWVLSKHDRYLIDTHDSDRSPPKDKLERYQSFQTLLNSKLTTVKTLLNYGLVK